MKKIATIIFLLAIALFMSVKIYIYYTYHNVYESVLSSNDAAKYHTKSAINIEVPIVSDIKDYYKKDLGFLTIELPYEELLDQLTTNGITAYTFRLKGTNDIVVVRPVDMVTYGDSVYDHSLLEKWNEKYNLKLGTHKDFYDAMWLKDFSKVGIFTSIKTTLEYSEILTQRSVITPSGEVYQFTNNNYYGYIISGDNVVIHLFNEKGNSISEIAISEKLDLKTIKNIVGSIKIK